MAYNEEEIAEVLISLALNRYNVSKTEEETGVSSRTIRRWAKNATKKGVPELLERAVEQLLMKIPDKMTGEEWAVALGILMDKWLLMQGQATSRTEQNIYGWLQNLPDKELDKLVKEFEQAANNVVSSKDGAKKKK